MIHGAGILFLTSEKRALFLRRGNGGDYPGHWCFPGGTQEDGESLEECAEREAIEELGFLPGGDRTLLTRTVLTIDDSASEAASTVDYTTYAQRVSTEFAPRLNGEHTAYTWASTEEPPQLMHPGCLLALQRLTMDELDVAEAMADGRLASPQHVDNMALFCMRISGTGTSYRQAHKEFVWRDPSVWLTPRMMKRASGLSLIMEHPEKSMMDSKEFNDRIVGMVFLPYVKDDELWAVVKVYDAPTIRMLEEGQLSTSPAVVFKPDANIKVNSDDEDGEALLIEGEPSLLDHLAICGRGVWDKGGPPVGIETNSEVRKDSDIMTEEEKMALAASDKAKKDGEGSLPGDTVKEEIKKDAESATGNIDSLLAKLDAACKRMDAMEEAAMDKSKKDGDEDEKDKKEEDKKDADEGDMPGDPKEVVADKKRKDADEGEKEELKKVADKARKDAAAAEANSAAVMKRMAALEALMKPRSDEDQAALASAQSRADSVFSALGSRAKPAMVGETLADYRRRLATELKAHSTAWKDVDLYALPDAALSIAETQVYADAATVAMHPTAIGDGSLRELVRLEPLTGRRIIEFAGHPRDWMDQFAMAPQKATLNLRRS